MSHCAIERRRRAALAMIQRGLHEDENTAAQAMDRSLRTYFYIKSTPEWLELRDSLEIEIRNYAWTEWRAAVESGNLDRAGDICHTFDLIGLRGLKKSMPWVQISDDW